MKADVDLMRRLLAHLRECDRATVPVAELGYYGQFGDPEAITAES